MVQRVGMVSRLSLIILCLLTLSVTGSLQAETNKVYTFSQQEDSGGWYPYQIPEGGDKPGILLELTPIIFERAGLALRMEYLPEKRSITGYREGWIDFEWVSPAWFPLGKLPDTDIHTIPVLQATEVVYSKATTPQIWKTPESLQGQEVGTIRGYSYATDTSFFRHDVLNEAAMVRMISAGRLLVGISDELSARYWASKQNMPIRIQSVYSSGPIVIRTKKAKNASVIPLLNQAIHDIKAEGWIEQIVRTYISH